MIGVSSILNCGDCFYICTCMLYIVNYVSIDNYKLTIDHHA